MVSPLFDLKDTQSSWELLYLAWRKRAKQELQVTVNRAVARLNAVSQSVEIGLSIHNTLKFILDVFQRVILLKQLTLKRLD
jgi:hypothetical protein